MKLIGKGTFSRVYRKGKSQKVYIKSNDFCKECMALGWFPNTPLFPKIKISDLDGYDYMSRYYPKMKSVKMLNKKGYERYQVLRKIYTNLPFHKQNYDGLMKVFSQIKDKTLKKNMILALRALSNYGQDIAFEISPRNISMGSGNNLVLLDCFLIQSQHSSQNHNF